MKTVIIYLVFLLSAGLGDTEKAPVGTPIGAFTTAAACARSVATMNSQTSTRRGDGGVPWICVPVELTRVKE
jgi:hypothetical protein